MKHYKRLSKRAQKRTEATKPRPQRHLTSGGIYEHEVASNGGFLGEGYISLGDGNFRRSIASGLT